MKDCGHSWQVRADHFYMWRICNWCGEEEHDMAMGPYNGWRDYWKSVRVLRPHFRKAEYPMGPVGSWVEALKFARRWP
jgi:hypothetical protein